MDAKGVRDGEPVKCTQKRLGWVGQVKVREAVDFQAALDWESS